MNKFQLEIGKVVFGQYYVEDAAVEIPEGVEISTLAVSGKFLNRLSLN